MPKRRITAGMELATGAVEAVDQIADGYGMKKNVVVSRVLAWFVGQPEAIQRLVLIPPRDTAGAYANELERLAGELRRRGQADFQNTVAVEPVTGEGRGASTGGRMKADTPRPSESTPKQPHHAKGAVIHEGKGRLT